VTKPVDFDQSSTWCSAFDEFYFTIVRLPDS